MEHEIQCAVFRWAQQYPELVLMHASLEGVRLPIGLAKKMKAAGMKPGFPDIILDVARGGYHGFRLELKTKTGKVSKIQALIHQALMNEGYKVAVAYSFNEAITEITNYLHLQNYKPACAHGPG